MTEIETKPRVFSSLKQATVLLRMVTECDLDFCENIAQIKVCMLTLNTKFPFDSFSNTSLMKERTGDKEI